MEEEQRELAIEAGKDNAAETCMICGQQQTEGLHIVEEFICADCEREMVHTDVWDAKYPFFIHQMKQVWQRKNA